MKLAIATLLAVVSLTAVAPAANAMPHRRHVKVCSMMHHHRSCHYVWR
jgi:hypothetical protein